METPAKIAKIEPGFDDVLFNCVTSLPEDLLENSQEANGIDLIISSQEISSENQPSAYPQEKPGGLKLCKRKHSKRNETLYLKIRRKMPCLKIVLDFIDSTLTITPGDKRLSIQTRDYDPNSSCKTSPIKIEVGTKPDIAVNGAVEKQVFSVNEGGSGLDFDASESDGDQSDEPLQTGDFVEVLLDYLDAPQSTPSPIKVPVRHSRRKPLNPMRAVRDSDLSDSPRTSPTRRVKPRRIESSDEDELDKLLGLDKVILDRGPKKGFIRKKKKKKKPSLLNTRLAMEGPHKCEPCKLEFQHYSGYVKHQKEFHSPAKKHFCEECGKGFNRSQHLTRHARIHTGEKSFVCPYCEKGFVQKTYLERHVRRLHQTDMFRCSCGRKIVYENVLEMHELMHRGIRLDKTGLDNTKIHMCFHCNSQLNESEFNNAELHSCKNKTDKVFQCFACEVTADSSMNLCRHLATTHDYWYFKRYMLFPDTYLKKDNGEILRKPKKKKKLRNVVRIEKPTMVDENGELVPIDDIDLNGDTETDSETPKRRGPPKRAYDWKKGKQCELCGAILFSLSGWKSHHQTHAAHQTGVKKYECTICNRKFATGPRFYEHKKEAHNEEPIYQCEQCGARLKTGKNLRQHRQIHYDKKHNCAWCGKAFHLKYNLDAHIIVAHTGNYPYRCEACDKPFLRKGHFEQHRQSQHGIMTPAPSASIAANASGLLITPEKLPPHLQQINHHSSQSNRSPLFRNTKRHSSEEEHNAPSSPVDSISSTRDGVESVASPGNSSQPLPLLVQPTATLATIQTPHGTILDPRFHGRYPEVAAEYVCSQLLQLL